MYHWPPKHALMRLTVFSPDGAAQFHSWLTENNYAESESVELKGSNKQQSQLNLVSVIQSFTCYKNIEEAIGEVNMLNYHE